MVSQPEVSPLPSPTLSIEEQTKNWKNYASSKFGYSMRYPSVWFDKGEKSSDWGVWRDFASVNIEAPIAGLGSGIWLRVSALMTINQEGFWNTQADETYFNYLHDMKVNEVRTGDPRYLITKLSDLTIDNYPAVEQIKETAPDAQTEYAYVVEVYILKDKQLFKIEGMTLNKQNWQAHRDTFDLILQTFKFTNDETTDWKTYRNEEAERGYSLKYPEGWIISREHKDLEGETRQAYDTTTLTKGDYKISIAQFLGGVGSCLFPEDPDKEGMYGRYGDYIEMKVVNRTVRRAKSLVVQNAYTFCEKRNGDYVATTSVGGISYKVPLDESEEILNKMDSIVKSIQPIE